MTPILFHLYSANGVLKRVSQPCLNVPYTAAYYSTAFPKIPDWRFCFWWLYESTLCSVSCIFVGFFSLKSLTIAKKILTNFTVKVWSLYQCKIFLHKCLSNLIWAIMVLLKVLGGKVKFHVMQFLSKHCNNMKFYFYKLSLFTYINVKVYENSHSCSSLHFKI